MLDAETIIATLGLQPHPEGGHYLETWRADAPDGGRSAGSAIYYLLRAGERSAWHRVDAAEAWHHYAGAPLELRIASGSGDEAAQRHVLGTDVSNGQRPQLIVPAGDWQSAATLGEWTLVGCTVSPAFEFAAFELAQPGWEPGMGPPAAGAPGASPATRERAVIRVVGANPAMDRISTWPPLRLGDVNRAASVAVVPGGKGFNVARAAIRLGTAAAAYGFLGGPVGAVTAGHDRDRWRRRPPHGHRGRHARLLHRRGAGPGPHHRPQRARAGRQQRRGRRLHGHGRGRLSARGHPRPVGQPARQRRPSRRGGGHLDRQRGRRPDLLGHPRRVTARGGRRAALDAQVQPRRAPGPRPGPAAERDRPGSASRAAPGRHRDRDARAPRPGHRGGRRHARCAGCPAG